MYEKENAPEGAPEQCKDTNFIEDTQLSKAVIASQSVIVEDIEDNIRLINESDKQVGMFRVRLANKCLQDAQNQPEPRKLYGDLIYEGDLSLLFADTNVGKSIKAVQIADVISKTDKVLYIDLEQSDKQFQKRYSEENQSLYPFNNNLLRIDFTQYLSIPEGYKYDDYFSESLRLLIETTEAKIVIIDNMSKLITTDTDKAQAAKPLMDRLIELKREYGLTLLLLEHTRKTDSGQPISLNDLQGSKMKVNFADSVFSIGRSSKDPNYRYIKQLKCRSSEIVYDAENVAVYEIVKENSFLHFKFIENSTEREHLKQLDDNGQSARINNVLELKKQGLSNVAIGNRLDISEGTVRKILKKAENSH